MSYTSRLVDLFTSRPGEWFDAYTLSKVAGFAGWRTRTSEALTWSGVMEQYCCSALVHAQSRPTGRTHGCGHREPRLEPWLPVFTLPPTHTNSLARAPGDRAEPPPAAGAEAMSALAAEVRALRQRHEAAREERDAARAEVAAARDLLASGAVTEELLAGERDAARAEVARQQGTINDLTDDRDRWQAGCATNNSGVRSRTSLFSSVNPFIRSPGELVRACAALWWRWHSVSDALVQCQAEAARLREKLDRLTVASERVLECEGWGWRYGKGWELLPYQAQLNQAVREAKAALEADHD